MYESHYLRAVDPARPRGAWIRHTSHQRPGEAPTGALWCTVWDAEAGPPYAVKQSLPAPSPPAGARFAGSASAARALGRLGARGGRRRGRPCATSRARGCTARRSRAPSSRARSRTPCSRGWIEAGGRRTEVAGWRGMVGHNWGSEHAERWVWLHAVGFAEAPGAWLDVALGRVRVGRVVTPWIANGALSLDGARLALGGIGRVRSTRVDARPGALRAVIGGAGATVRATVSAPLEQTVAFEYVGGHHALNCSIAEVRLRVERPGRPALELASAFGGAYELGVRETDHGVPVEPFPDP